VTGVGYSTDFPELSSLEPRHEGRAPSVQGLADAARLAFCQGCLMVIRVYGILLINPFLRIFQSCKPMLSSGDELTGRPTKCRFPVPQTARRLDQLRKWGEFISFMHIPTACIQEKVETKRSGPHNDLASLFICRNTMPCNWRHVASQA
jgi:hypothetical protein